MVSPEFLLRICLLKRILYGLKHNELRVNMQWDDDHILSMQCPEKVAGYRCRPVETQQAIVAEIEAEQALVSANSDLVERMEQRIQDAIGRVWEGGRSTG